MTREEAIQVLESMSDISTQGEAINMAIEALSADTVSREEYEDLMGCYEALVGYNDLVDDIADLIMRFEERG